MKQYSYLCLLMIQAIMVFFVVLCCDWPESKTSVFPSSTSSKSKDKDEMKLMLQEHSLFSNSAAYQKKRQKKLQNCIRKQSIGAEKSLFLIFIAAPMSCLNFWTNLIFNLHISVINSFSSIAHLLPINILQIQPR